MTYVDNWYFGDRGFDFCGFDSDSVLTYVPVSDDTLADTVVVVVDSVVTVVVVDDGVVDVVVVENTLTMSGDDHVMTTTKTFVAGREILNLVTVADVSMIESACTDSTSMRLSRARTDHTVLHRHR